MADPALAHTFQARIFALVKAAATCCSVLLLSSCMLSPGGGGSTQGIPESVKSGEPAVIKLGLSVWGSGGSIKGRYTDVRTFYRRVGEDGYKALNPVVIPQDAKHETCEFTIPAYPQGTTGEVEFYFELKLDGQPSRIEGAKKIRIE